jgi:hypothetical protein
MCVEDDLSQNAGVKAFEMGDSEKALAYLFAAIEPASVTCTTNINFTKISRRRKQRVILDQFRQIFSNSLEIRPSQEFGGKRRNSQKRKKNNSILESYDPTVPYVYSRLFRIMVSSSTSILKQICYTKLLGIAVTNVAICLHRDPNQSCHALQFYKLAAKTVSQKKDVFRELIIWNNLIEINSEHLFDISEVMLCVQMLQKLLNEGCFGVLSDIESCDRKGFFFNAALLQYAFTLAPAA